jgi:hypothetical protein
MAFMCELKALPFYVTIATNFRALKFSHERLTVDHERVSSHLFYYTITISMCNYRQGIA